MIKLEFDQTLAAADERLSPEVIRSVQTELNQRAVADQDGVIAIRLISDAEIQKLNRMYRKKDSVTDVLSFAYEGNPGQRGNLGDIVISLEQAKRQAYEDDLELELVDLIVHGALHVLGFDHEEPHQAQEMFTLQDAIVAHIL